MSPERGQRSRLENAGVVALVAVLLVLLFRDVARVAPNDDAMRRKAFEEIYSQGVWGEDQEAGTGTSGPGSTLEATKPYRAYLQDFLAQHEIRSVVDAGCGDWEFSRAIDWKGIDYLGLDIVGSVVESNRRRFGSSTIRFAVADIVREELPPADLLLIKDVLQHLSHADIARVLAKLPRFRHVLIVNDVNGRSLTAEPADITSGGYRQLDLTRPPHALKGVRALVWQYGGSTKLVLHLRGRDTR